MFLKIECQLKWNVTQNGMLLKMECRSKWSVTKNGMSHKMECHSKRNVTKNEMSLKLECYSNSNLKCQMSHISGFSKFYANSMSALRLIEYHCKKKCLVAFPTIFSVNAVRPGFVFIEKLQNNELTIISFAALRRPDNDI